MAIKVQMAEVARTQRVNRYPQHPFQIRTRPWVITPFMIAPVLPGETFRNLLFQTRCVTDPVKSPLIGWWNEYYFYYVKHRDLAGRDDFSAMMLDPSTDLSAYNGGAQVEFYHGEAGSIDWVKWCTQCVVEYDFRQSGEGWLAAGTTIGGLPAAQYTIGRNWLDSAMNDADHAAIADIDVDLNSDSTITASEIDQAMIQWQLLRTQGMTNLTYEDYLASYGVRPSTVDLHRPELIRYIREWSYPTNTIDPSDGSAASAISWKMTEKADKDRFFKEPGFILGLTVKRPKVYLSGQNASATNLMSDLYAWLPAVLAPEVEASIRKVAAGASPLTNNTDAYWIDVKDLLLYGEQFVNFALTETDAGFVALPTAGLQKRYASSTDADGLFASASPANQIREDGIVSLTISGAQRDTSQTT